MHALVWGLQGNVADPDQFIVEVAQAAFGKLRDSARRRMTAPGTIDVRRVYDAEGVSDYVMKDLGKSEKRRSRLWLIKANGFDRATDYFY